MSVMERAISRSNAVANTAAASIKAKGGGGIMAPSQGMGQVIGFQQQGANRERYSLFRGWLYAAINALASEAAGQPVHVGRLKGVPAKENRERPGKRKGQFHIHRKMTKRAREKAAKNELEVLENHPFIAQLEKPNEVQGKWQFVYSFVANLCLTGWSYIVTDGDEYYSVPTTWVTPVHDKGPFSSILLQNPNDPAAEPKPFERGQFGFAHLPNPANPLAATAPATAQITAIRIDDHIQTSQEQFFENGIFPSVIVTMGKDPHPDVPGGVRPRLTATQRRQVHAAISKVMGGVQNYGTPAIVDGLIESIERLSATQTEMGWEKSEDKVRTRILSAFGVHPYILGEAVSVGGYAQVANIEKRFFKRVNTYLDMLGELMTNFAAPGKDKDKLLVWWEECEAVDPSVYWANINAARGRNDITQTEYRALLGMPPDEDGVEAQIDVATAGVVVQILTAVGTGAVSPAQAMAAFTGLGISEDLAEELAGDGPSAQLQMAQQQLEVTQQQLQANPDEQAKKEEEKVKALIDALPKFQSLRLTPKAFVDIKANREYGCIMLRLPGNMAEAVRAMAASIPDEDLAPDGREDDPHVTVKFGLHTDDVEEVRSVLAGAGPVGIRFGGVSLFENEEHDVVKLDVAGPTLHALNAKVSTELECTDTHPTYKPHCTIAYVKAGLGKGYRDKLVNSLAGKTATFTEVVFSDKERNHQMVSLVAGNKGWQDQPRVPAGSPEGGQWGNGGGVISLVGKPTAAPGETQAWISKWTGEEGGIADYNAAVKDGRSWVNGAKNPVLDELYADTQAKLKAAGINGVKVYRGVQIGPDHPLYKDLKAGKIKQDQEVEIDGADFASWTTHEGIAHEFAKENALGERLYLGAGVVFERIVKAEDIITGAAVHTGFIDREAEVVAKRPEGKFKVRITRAFL